MTTRRDLLLRSGTTLGEEVRYEIAGPAVAVNTLVAGDRVWYQAAPWDVHSSEAVNATTWRLRLGGGRWWEPDLLLAPDDTLPRAEAQTWLTYLVSWRDPYGRRNPIPAEVDPDGVTMILVPHTDAARDWSTEFGQWIDGTIAPPAPPTDVPAETWRTAYDYDLVATFEGLPGSFAVLEGTLIVQPSVAVPEPVVAP